MKTGFLLLSAVLVAAFTLPFRSTKTQAAVSAGGVVAAKSNAFSFLRTQREGQGVTTAWGISSAENVLDFIVQRTYEDPANSSAYWENIAATPSSSLRSFTYTDSEVFPGTVYYRIVALLTDGSTVHSEISDVRIEHRK